MKPFYKSKKVWTAVITLVAVAAAEATGNAALTEPIMTLGAVLLVAIMGADWGKEAKALEANGK